MSTKTLLELTQDIISDMSGDYINSITDTDEAEQIATIIKNTYWKIIDKDHAKWEHLRSTVTLDSANDLSKPTHLKLNADVYKIKDMWYNKRRASDTRDKYHEVQYLVPDDFISYVNQRDDSKDNVTQVTDYGGIKIAIRTDHPPTYYTSFDDEYFVFDSYDSEVESTLQASKTQAIVIKIPTWTHTDAGVPDLPPQMFSLLLSEASSAAWLKLKQTANEKDEQDAQRQMRGLALDSHRINTGARRMVKGRRSRR